MAGLFDLVKTALGSAMGQAESQMLPQILDKVLASTDMGNLQGLLARLQQSGLGPQVSSWLGNGPNTPITAQQLEAALGDDLVAKISGMLNMPPDEIFGPLAAQLPGLIDRLSPNGHLPA